MVKIDASKFLGKSKSYIVMGEEVVLEPLKGKDMDLFMNMKEGQELQGIKKLICHYFELTSEQFDECPVSFINESAEAIMDINGFSKK